MFEFDAGKLVIIGIVALVVIGPKELPRVMRQIGQIVGKMRRLAGDFQAQFMDAMREAEFAELKAEATKLADAAKLDVDFNPVADVKSSLTEALQGPAGKRFDDAALGAAAAASAITHQTDAAIATASVEAAAEVAKADGEPDLLPDAPKTELVETEPSTAHGVEMKPVESVHLESGSSESQPESPTVHGGADAAHGPLHPAPEPLPARSGA